MGAAQVPGESVKSGGFRRLRGAGERRAVCLEAAELRQLLSCSTHRVLSAAAGQRHHRGRCRAGTAAHLRDPGECVGVRAVHGASGASTAIAKGFRCRWRHLCCRSGHAAAVV